MVIRVSFNSICRKSTGIPACPCLPAGWGRQGRDFVGFRFRGDLPQGDAFLAGPGTDDMQRTEVLPRVVRAATALAIDRDESLPGRRRSLRVGRGNRRRDPGLETVLKGFGLQSDEDAAKAIAGGNAVGKREVLAEPLLAFGGPPMNGRRPVATAEDAGDANDDRLDQQVLPIPRVTGVFERFEVGTNRGDIHELIHDKILQRSVVNLAPQSSKRKSPKLTIYARWPWVSTAMKPWPN